MTNNSGYIPVQYRVLLEEKKTDNKSAGGIYLPDDVADKERFANTEGTIVAVGCLAFTEPDWNAKPKAGDKVLFNKYAGSIVKGKDGEEYRLINDSEIAAIELME